MKVFLTGAAGFVGSRLSKTLLKRGDTVVGFDNLNDYYDIVHKERHLLDLRDEKGFTFIKGDLRDAELMRKLMEEHRPDTIAHLAGMAAVRYSIEHPLIYGEVNVQGSLNLIDAARLVGRPRCVLASTGSVYGSVTPVPFKEDAAADRPLAPYPASKRAMELMAHSHHHLFGLPITVVRFFNVYGPHGRPDMMPWQWSVAIHREKPITLYNAGKMKRDWTYVDDIVAGFVGALDTDLKFEILNLGCGNPVENLDFVKVIEDLVGKKAIVVDKPAPASEPIVTYADVSKSRRLIGYEPKVRVEEGLKRFIEWMRAEKLM
ncbi:MAG TPA: NAD-dependent epimerase/dehydratase family protein [Tepidisphaeraceae bacterium]|jgi:UDP-glucuronate 4-epimerase|nr:NAD-dependent epimerase/dehydratase family protein [Tepidisphaeraceae bacterium]